MHKSWFLVAFQHRLFFIANHWHASNGHIIVGRIITSPINLRTYFSVKQSEEEGDKSFKRHQECQCATRSSHNLPRAAHTYWDRYTLWLINQFHWGIRFYCGQDVCGWADCNSVQKECTSHTDLLERFLQLWTLHCLPRTYNFGLAMSDKLNPQSDHMGVFLSAVLFVDWQLCRRGFQEDVSILT